MEYLVVVENNFREYKEIIHNQLSNIFDITNERVHQILKDYPNFETAINKPEISIAIASITLFILLIVPFITRKSKKNIKVSSKPSDTNLVKTNNNTTQQPSQSTNGKSSQALTTDTQPRRGATSNNDSLSTLEKSPTAAAPSVSPQTSPNSSSHEVDDFIRRLRLTGFKIERLKHSQSKDQTLKLTSKGDLRWSRSFFSKYQPLNSIVSAFEADDGFILEFKKKSLHFRMKSTEHPYNATVMVKLFNLVIIKLKVHPNFIIDICKANGIANDDDYDDNASQASENSRLSLGSPFHSGGVKKAAPVQKGTPNKSLSPVLE